MRTTLKMTCNECIYYEPRMAPDHPPEGKDGQSLGVCTRYPTRTILNKKHYSDQGREDAFPMTASWWSCGELRTEWSPA